MLFGNKRDFNLKFENEMDLNKSTIKKIYSYYKGKASISQQEYDINNLIETCKAESDEIQLTENISEFELFCDEIEQINFNDLIQDFTSLDKNETEINNAFDGCKFFLEISHHSEKKRLISLIKKARGKLSYILTKQVKPQLLIIVSFV